MPLELSLTQGVAKPLANRSLDLARLRAERSAPDRMDPNINPKLGRVALVEHSLYARPVLHKHLSSPRLIRPVMGARRSPLEDEHADELREQETGSDHAVFGRIAASAESKTGVGIGTPTARSAAQWAPAPIASTRMLGWG